VHRSLSDIIKPAYSVDSLVAVEDALLYDHRSMLCHIALSIKMKESVVISKKGLILYGVISKCRTPTSSYFH